MTTDTIADFPPPPPPEEILDEIVKRTTAICGLQAGDLDDEATAETTKNVFLRIAQKHPRWPELNEHMVQAVMHKAIVAYCQEHGIPYV
jgi:hypothetical protein